MSSCMRALIKNMTTIEQKYNKHTQTKGRDMQKNTSLWRLLMINDNYCILSASLTVWVAA